MGDPEVRKASQWRRQPRKSKEMRRQYFREWKIVPNEATEIGRALYTVSHGKGQETHAVRPGNTKCTK